MKSFLEWLAIIGISLAVATGVVLLLNFAFSQQAKFDKEDEAQCAKITQLANGKDYKYDNGYGRCYFVKDGKLEVIDL